MNIKTKCRQSYRKGLGAFFMTKKVKISFLILVWGIVAIQLCINRMDQLSLRQNAVFPSANNDKKENVITAFSIQSQDTPAESLKGFGYLGTMEVKEEAKVDTLKKFARSMGIEDGYILSGKEGDNYTATCLSKDGKYAKTMIQFVTIRERDETPEQYIWVDITTEADVMQGNALYHKLCEVYSDMDMSYNVNMEYTIQKKGDISKDKTEKQLLIDEIFSKFSAKQVTLLDNEDYDAVYGYTKQDDNYYEIDGEKINIQIVFSYSEAEDITYIKVGCPIVNSSY